MRRLTLSVRACTETMGLLVAMAWADGHLDEEERDGLHDAAKTLNLPRELRERLESFADDKLTVADVKLDTLKGVERDFAYVCAAWMANVARGIDDSEIAMLDEVAAALDIDEARQGELAGLALDLPVPEPGQSWAQGIRGLFSAVRAKVERSDEPVEVDIG